MATPTPYRFKFPALHETQAQLVQDKTRFRVAACGRRWGKSAGAELESIATALTGRVVWYVCPDFTNSEDRWKEMLALVAQMKVPGLNVSQELRTITFPHHGLRQGRIVIKSAHEADKLRGSGLDLVILEEAGVIPKLEYLWTNVLRPALSDRQGRGLFIGSPSGMGSYFYKLYGFGLDPAKPDWASFCYPTATNPFIPASEIEAAEADLPELVFRQEYKAEFIPDGGGVFRGVLDACTAKTGAQRVSGHSYVMALDWGRSNDFTAISVIDSLTRMEVQLERFTGQLYALQRDRIKAIYEYWLPGEIWAEANSIGAPNIEALQAEGIPVRPFQMTNTSKTDIVNTLALSIERTSQGLDNGVTYLDDPVGIQELQNFEYDISPTGVMRYGARSGSHDDTVIARAIATKMVINGAWSDDDIRKIGSGGINPAALSPSDIEAARLSGIDIDALMRGEL